ncbi:NAD(P)H-hydrate dehydratase [Sulfurospirillum diekertiae]|uniref:NAD(P)H-hydrate epimerase n=1 Tax=Sulfurospirillum diekertiae TaxID=1854492 RepID=A0A6G9VT38_9BACT|nr:NAD(P)H-hydrate dehydratase [Sulfurospirillum diekertiae]QIR75835.1 NAD(P)H-hydrate dehydratase [Sulfurospirillum diekertiae]QIR78480.1 NAD(P)H-hydrate dehydratase [Sulfurospirillum diekertiae]
MQYVYEETASLDERCYTTFGLTPEILMEHAGSALARAVKKKLTCKKSALFICGMGNNGADGIVAARLLHGAYNISIYLPFELKSALAKRQLERAKKVGVVIVDELINADIYVDALFGAGLNRPLDTFTCKLLETLNTRKGYKIACDIPSGILSNLTLSSVIFQANETITMGALKLGLLNDNVKDAVGDIKVAKLGVSRSQYETLSPLFLLRKSDLKLPIRVKKNANKGTFGHAAIVQGSKEGAARLAGMGAFHFGAGLVTLIGEKPKKLPLYLMNSETLPKNANVIVAGMGLEMPFDEIALKTLLLSNDLPLVIDASLSHHPLIVEIIASQKPVVLTPHPKEFSAILELTCKEHISVEMIQANRFEHAKRFSLAFPHVVLVLKGANTIIAHNGELFINTYGTQALAKGGSGDVMSGMIGALIAQGYSPKDAAINGSLAHALVSRAFTCNNFALTPVDICKGLKWL